MRFMTLVRLCSVAAFASAALVPMACAEEGDADPQEPPDAGVDSGRGVKRDAGRDSAAPVADGGFKPCVESGLCVVPAPIDTSINLMSVWGSSADDVWAVGTNHTFLHYDGSVWESQTIKDDASLPYTLFSVWLNRPDDVWVVDGPFLRHSTGWKGSATEWSTYGFIHHGSLSSNIPMGLSGKDGTVWVARLGWSEVDPAGTIVRCTGWGSDGPLDPEYVGFNGDFDTFFGAGYDAVVSTGADEAWATSAGVSVLTGSRVARIFRSTDPDGGPMWQHEEFNSRTTKSLYGIWGNEENVWLVGEGGLSRRVTRSAIPSRSFEILETGVTANLRAVFGFGAGDVWAVGDESTVLHWDGSAWTKVATPFDRVRDKPTLYSVWGSSKDDVWISGNGVVLHFERSGS